MKTWWNLAAVALMALVPVTAASSGAEPDRLNPSDAEIVLQINVRSLLHTPLVQKHALDSLKALLRRNDEVSRLLDAAGLDSRTATCRCGRSTVKRRRFTRPSRATKR
jgi:hypothetical protein